jgi:Cof subfamily protein (haloacid dehalogenase superfamily)
MPADTHDLSELAALAEAPDIRLIASDMDGTLLDEQKRVNDDFWPLIEELHERGVTFCPASGRQYASLREQFADIAEDLVFVAENGTYVVDGATGQEVSSDCLDLSDAKEIITHLRDVPGTHLVLCGKRSAYVESVASFGGEVEPYYHALQEVDDLLSVEGEEVLKVAVFDTINSETNAAPALEKFRDRHQVVVSGAHWVDVMTPTANKGAGLRQIQARLGVSEDQTMVFGDFLNDVEMMGAATYSFAMANAHPRLQELATWRAPANSANGVVRTIRTALRI